MTGEEGFLLVSVQEDKYIKQCVQDIQSLCFKKKQTLAFAESCTGGLLSYWLTSFPGASEFFLGSVICYSYQAKINYLGVSSQVLKKKGAVNEEICSQMAEGVLKRLNSDWALSITGVAGPKKMNNDPPVGTVFITLLGPNYRQVEHSLIKAKNRREIQERCAFLALNILLSGIK